ncbi:MAG: putative NADPH-dependent glutamate synthase small subunit [bacterium ADurb.Bin429]|nr:MAG: putative NADPH-dependent glutamate synthase small subunit [bacterium ADurb.Bin429]
MFLGVGAAKGYKLGIAGEELEGVVESIDFLRDYNLTGHAAVGRRVVIVGGGNAAIDAARTAHRLGAESGKMVRVCRADYHTRRGRAHCH